MYTVPQSSADSPVRSGNTLRDETPVLRSSSAIVQTELGSIRILRSDSVLEHLDSTSSIGSVSVP